VQNSSRASRNAYSVLHSNECIISSMRRLTAGIISRQIRKSHAHEPCLKRSKPANRTDSRDRTAGTCKLRDNLREMIIDVACDLGRRLTRRVCASSFGTFPDPFTGSSESPRVGGAHRSCFRGAERWWPNFRGKDLREKFAIVRVLEAHAASTICETASPTQIQALEAIHRQLLAAHKKRNDKLYFELNEKFHREVVAATGSKTLTVSAFVPGRTSASGAFHRPESAHTMEPEFVEESSADMRAIAARQADVAGKEFIKHQIAVERETIAYFESGEAGPCARKEGLWLVALARAPLNEGLVWH